jgi:hypothetical protein
VLASAKDHLVTDVSWFWVDMVAGVMANYFGSHIFLRANTSTEGILAE